MSKFVCLILLLSLTVTPAFAVVDKVRVRLFDAHKEAPYIVIMGPARVVAARDQFLPPGEFRAERRGQQIVIRPEGSGSMLVRSNRSIRLLSVNQAALRVAPGGVTVGAGIRPAFRRRYLGDIVLRIEKQKVVAENIVSARDYVAGVVGSEVMVGCPGEALKAQAVLVLTRLARLKQGEVISDSTQDEAYLGVDFAKPSVVDAVRSVWGQVLTAGGAPIQVFFHSTCAGHTSKGEDVFGQPAKALTYLASVKCDFCSKSPFFKTTTTTIPAADFERKFGKGLPQLQSLDPGGRPRTVVLAGKHSLSGYQFWISLGQTFGWDKCPGTAFSITKPADNAIQIQSRGAGHGVGMCQWGAAGQADSGKDYKSILTYYFPNTKIEKRN